MNRAALSATHAYVDGMAWVLPKFSRDVVDEAGARFIDPSSSRYDRSEALAVIDNWRAAHSFPLNTFQMNLRTRARRVGTDPLVARRLKRLSSIETKLRRLRRLQLSEIQDLGGCRAIVPSVGKVYEVVDLHNNSRSLHELVKTDDYIDRPRNTGYRSVHLIYSYRSDEMTAYNDLLIEVQIRSGLQHAWATAVETVGTFRGEPLKAGSGDPKWLRFFALMASEIAAGEACALVPGTPDDVTERRGEIRELCEDLQVVERLNAYRQAVTVVGTENARQAHTFLLELDAVERSLMVTSFQRRYLALAQQRYSEVEQEKAGDPRYDVVLVSVADIKNLRSAYPNYFADTSEFVRLVGTVIDS